MNVIEPGELFGEIAGFGGGRRTATVTALGPCEVLTLSADQLQRGFTDSPDLLRKTLQVLAGRARRISDRQVVYREEHKALREVQRSLLPDLGAIDSQGRFRVEAAWEPCTYASGDYYDVVQIAKERFLFAVGDVMGHGAEASLMMAVARAQIREMARHFRRTDELLLNLDGYLRAQRSLWPGNEPDRRRTRHADTRARAQHGGPSSAAVGADGCRERDRDEPRYSARVADSAGHRLRAA